MKSNKRIFARKSRPSPEQERAYEAFVRTAVISKRRICYPVICRRLGISCMDLDKIVRRELGMSGRELLEAYRRSSAAH